MKKIREIIHVFFFCIPLAIVVYTGCMIGILIYNLIKFMDTKKINDIEVKDFVDLSPSKETMRAIEIAQAKKLLKSEGYFVDNLWQTCDVTMNYDCTEEEAQEVLEGALTNEATYQQIWEAISYEAESMNLKRRD
jgi:hypothetical protein